MLSTPAFVASLVVSVVDPRSNDIVTKSIITTSFLVCIIELIPTLIMGTDLVCDSNVSQGVDSGLESVFVKGNGSFCHFQRISKHIMQISTFLMALQTSGLRYRSLYSVDIPGKKTLIAASFLVPMLLAVISLFLDDENNFGQVREIFSCNPRLSSVGLEIGVVWTPYGLGTLIIVFSSLSMLSYYLKITKAAVQSQSAKSGNPLFTGLSGKLFFIASMNAVLMMLTAIAAILILPQLADFDDEAVEWKRCEAFEQICNDYENLKETISEEDRAAFGCDKADLNCVDPSSAPSAALLGLFYLCTPFSCLVVSFTFASSATTVEYWKKKMSTLSVSFSRKSGAKSSSAASITPSSGQSSLAEDSSVAYD